MQAAAANKPKPAAAKGASDNVLGKTIGGCRIDSLLGRGAMGAVYKARQVSLDRDVAVKVIRPEMMTDPRMLKRFEVEARTVGKFNSAHVVMVHDVGFEHGMHYLVMEFVQGKNMREHTKLLAGGRLPAGEAIPLLRQACKGLEEAQRLGVIHRDIKPDNLMLTDRGVLKIADFGIAKPIHEDFNMTMTSELIGTPLYMSPEQCQGKGDLDFRSDMYSLGATFYYLLTGEPPIRASSVYELIQTKTKLENLCLWKALAELDQNHPLSRVIERMTSLDRTDRYESYESLLNDIVLVEQGGTVTIPQKGSARARAAQQKAKKKKRNVLVGAVLLLAVAGGGYAWSVSAGGGAGPADGKVMASVPDTKQLVEKLTSLKNRLANNGPDPSLRTEVAAVPEEPSTKASRSDLLEDVDRGLAVRVKLDKLKPPESLTVPFDDLRAYFASVDKALDVEGAGRDLQTWLNKARVGARAESALGAMGRESLTVAFREWSADRTKAGNDDTKLVELGKRLDVLAAGRRTLLVQIPSQEVLLERALPDKTLISARQSLTEKTVVPANDVDVSESLTEIQQKFEAGGPDAALVDRTKKLAPNRDDQIVTRDKLLIELERASEVASRLETTRINKPEDPELPFESVESYYAQIERALEPLRARTGGALPRWAEALRTTVRDEKKMQASVMRVCRTAYARWNKHRDESSGNASEELVAELQQLKLGIAAAGRLFPDSKAEFDKIIPETALAEVKAESERGKTRQAWLGSSKKLLQRLDVTQLADWRAVATQSNAELEALRTGAADLAKDPAVMGELQKATKLCERWTEADKRFTDLAAKIAAGDLKGADDVARAGVPGLEGKEEFKQLSDAAARCRLAFDGLDTRLEIDQASALLAEARELLKNYASLAPAADARIKEWIAKVGDLKRTAAGMVQIEAGTTKASPQQVQAFFLASTECSFGDFNKFLGELHTAVDSIKDPAERLQAVAQRLVGAEINQERLDSLLQRERRRVSDKLPADKIDWHAAAAYCAWNGLVLPTPAEWSLAAFGAGNRFPYPWGPDWSNDPQQRNTNNKQLAEVDTGGLSWRKADGKSFLHHLGGNVAEWLAAEPGTNSASQAGGRYNDSDSKAREAAGGMMSPVEKTDTRLGVGFRTALRPRTFIGQLWPR